MTQAEQWMKDNYFDPETGDWLKFDDYEAMQAYAEYYHKGRLREDLSIMDD